MEEDTQTQTPEDAQILLNQLQNKIELAKAELGDLEDGKNAVQQEKETLEKQIPKLKKDRDDIGSDLANTMLAKGKLEDEIKQKQSDLEGVKIDIQAKKDELSTVQQDVITAKDAAREADAQIRNDYQTTIMQIENQKLEAERARDVAENDRASALAAQTTAESDLKAKLEEFKNASDDLSAINATIVERQAAADAQKADLDAYMSDKAEIEKEISDKKAELKAVCDELGNKMIENTSVNGQVDLAKEELVTLNDSIKVINDRAFKVTTREKDVSQKEAYIKQLYSEAGVPLPEAN